MLEVEGVPLFQRVLRVLQEVFAQVLIAGDRKDLCSPDVPCYADPYPGSSLGGIYTGLYFAKTRFIFVASCDMPYVDADLVRRIVSRRRDFDAVVPRTRAGIERCFSVYGKACLEPLKQMLEAGEYQIDRLYPQVRVCYMDVDDSASGTAHSLMNINTPEEYRFIGEKYR
jgi:molybdopterin-guanine dinucleotide biosynthesis protein A